VLCASPEEEMGFLQDLPPPCNVILQPSTIGMSGKVPESPFLKAFERFLKGGTCVPVIIVNLMTLLGEVPSKVPQALPHDAPPPAPPAPSSAQLPGKKPYVPPYTPKCLNRVSSIDYR